MKLAGRGNAATLSRGPAYPVADAGIDERNDEMSRPSPFRGDKMIPNDAAELAQPAPDRARRLTFRGGTCIAGEPGVHAHRYTLVALLLMTLAGIPAASAQTTTSTTAANVEITEFIWDSGTANLNLTKAATNEYLINKAECYEILELGSVPTGCSTATTSATSSSTKEFSLRGNLTDADGSDIEIWVGSGCGTSDTTGNAAATDCHEVLAKTTIANAKAKQPWVFKSTELLGTSCTTVSKDVYFYVTDVGATTPRTARVNVELDVTPPSAPTLTGAAAGERNVDLTWDKVSDSDLDEYVVYYGTSTFTSDTGTASRTFGGTSTSGKVDGLTNGTTYYFGIVAVDTAGNASSFCTTADLVDAVPVEVFDGWEYYRANGGPEEGGYCYVATAAWNTPLAPAVTWLRTYRDTRMLTNDGGRALVDLYDVVGPEAAALVRTSPWLRGVVRWLLFPMIAVALLFAAWPVWGPLFGAGIALLMRRRRSTVKEETNL